MIKLFYPKFWRSRGPLAYLLWPLSYIYFLITKVRQYIASPQKLSAKVICIGNISVGGTGKTQLVIWLAKYFTKNDIKFVIVSNSYHSDLKGASLVSVNDHYQKVGDEALLLAKYGPVIACKKVQDSFALIEQIRPEIVIFDDRLQNPYFHKDCRILLIDNMRKFGNRFLLPAGPLRQNPSKALTNCDIIISVGNNFVGIDSLNLPPSFLLIQAKIVAVQPAQNRQNYIAFCGIGNPERFFETLELAGYSLINKLIYPDHHTYTIVDISHLEKLAASSEAKLITTTKDHLKLSSMAKVEAFETNLEFDDPATLLTKLYEKIF